MGSISLFARRLVLAGGFAVVAAAPVAGAAVWMPLSPPAQLANCPTGEDQDLYTGHCVPYMAPNSPDMAPNSPAGAPVPGDTQCPPGVSGAECGGSTGNELGSPQPQMPAPVPPQEPEQELAEVATPGY